MIDDYGDLGAAWTAEWRRLHVATDGWLDGRNVKQAMYNVKKAALIADELQTKHNVQQLDQAVKRLEREVLLHVKRLAELQKEVGYYVAAIVRHRALNAETPDPKPGWQLEQERIAELQAQAEIGLDRTAALYGLDRHRRLT